MIYFNWLEYNWSWYARVRFAIIDMTFDILLQMKAVGKWPLSLSKIFKLVRQSKNLDQGNDMSRSVSKLELICTYVKTSHNTAKLNYRICTTEILVWSVTCITEQGFFVAIEYTVGVDGCLQPANVKILLNYLQISFKRHFYGTILNI
jgi:hypothetical protein